MSAITSSNTKYQTRRWSREEHDKFMRGLEMFPHGPWSRIAALVGTRTARQTMTHAQKYRERMVRRAKEVHALWGARGQSGAERSVALLQETVRALPPTVSSHPLPSSDEDLMEENTVNGAPADLDELDVRILLSLLSPETDDTTTVGHPNLEPLTAAESHEFDHSILSLLMDLTDDLTQVSDEQ